MRWWLWCDVLGMRWWLWCVWCVGDEVVIVMWCVGDEVVIVKWCVGDEVVIVMCWWWCGCLGDEVMIVMSMWWGGDCVLFCVCRALFRQVRSRFPPTTTPLTWRRNGVGCTSPFWRGSACWGRSLKGNAWARHVCVLITLERSSTRVCSNHIRRELNTCVF